MGILEAIFLVVNIVINKLKLKLDGFICCIFILHANDAERDLFAALSCLKGEVFSPCVTQQRY